MAEPSPAPSPGSFSRIWSRIWIYLFSFLLGVLLSFAFTIFLTERNGTNLLIVEFSGFSNNLTQEIRNILAILIFGAFGGLLYSLRERKMELPYIGKNALPVASTKPSTNQLTAPVGESYEGKLVNLGIIADCLAGIGGALGVFLILPIDEIDGIPLFKLLATAMIGGYGGRSLLDRALGNILQKQEELEKEQKKTKEILENQEGQVQKQEEQVQKREEQSNKDAETIQLLSRYLDLSLTLSDEDANVLLNNIKTASREVRFGTIFTRAQSALYDNRLKVNDEPPSKAVIQNALKVFESLHESDSEQIDRYPAHVAYAQMALGEWEKAIKSLKEAQEILKNNDQDWLVYESNRVICKLNLNKEDIIGNLASLKDLNDKLKDLNNQVQPSKFKSTTLWDRVDELLNRPKDKEGYKSEILEWFKEHTINNNLEVITWLEEANIDLDSGNDGSEKQSSPGEVSQTVSNPNPVADTGQLKSDG